MKKIDIFPEFLLCEESTIIKRKMFPNALGVYNYRDFLITVYNNDGIRSVSIDNPTDKKIEDDELENIATHFIGLNYKIKTNYVIEEIRDDNN